MCDTERRVTYFLTSQQLEAASAWKDEEQEKLGPGAGEAVLTRAAWGLRSNGGRQLPGTEEEAERVEMQQGPAQARTSWG